MDRPCRSSGWRTRRWSPAAAASPATSISRASFTCGSCARNHAHANIVSIDTEAARDAARRGRGVDRGRHRRRAADRFPRRADREARALPPAGAGAATRCATSASRSRRCSPRTPTSPRTPPISSPWRSRSCRRCSMPATSPASSRSAATPRPRSCTQGYGDVEAVFKSARAYRRARSSPAAGIPACRWRRRGAHRPLRRLARRAGAARRREGAAPEQGADRADAQPRAVVGAVLRSRTSAAASASAARSIPRTSWSASRRCASSGR